jgi:MFS family permease
LLELQRAREANLNDGLEGSGYPDRPVTETKSTSTWLALRNPEFCRLWLASVLSGTFVAAQDVAATWLMHKVGATSFALSLMATAAAAPFFLLTLPAGAVADIANRRFVIVGAVLWQGACSALLALGAWTRVINPTSVLACIFALGIGLAFSAPVWGAIVPDIVSKDELPSAITLGGVQLNLSGIVGPAFGGLLLPLLGAPLLIALNALTFLVVAFAVIQWKPRQEQSPVLRENFTESFISSLRYARNSPRIKTILFRDLIFALVISIIPALLPVISLKEMHLSAGQLGLVFTCVGVGSLVGAVFLLPYLRLQISPNAITSLSMVIMVVVLLALALMRQLPVLLAGSTFAGMAWALAGAELWVAGQRVMPGWVRGRMNAFQIMLGQGGMALGAFLWGAGAAHAGLDWTFGAAAVVAVIVLTLGRQFSIDFSTEVSLDAAPLNPLHDFPVLPQSDAGPVTVTIEYAIESDRREEFQALMLEVQATCRRNGAFHCRLDECLEHPGKFRLEYVVSTWAEHLRQGLRMTADERRSYNTAWDLHSGDSGPVVRHYLATQRSVHLHGYGFCGRTFTDTWSASRPKLVSARSSPHA